MSFRRGWVRGAIAALIVAFGAVVFAFAAGADSKAILKTASGEHAISVEVADTPETRATGLMFRESMPDDHGMLFVFDEPRPVTFWMKNTLIPLDMLFLDDHGVITRIAANAQPLSLSLIDSEGPVRFVLELNGGAAARLKAQPGDRLIHERIEP
ncbi:DUF192 domain-containing protein [Consotaella salsifontis]|uniref:DUF192 domain-containing protein n=1 Tax=Consotaella salsifontis TaxID=1365950 RepID=A0A1T4L6B6_9HYPH|nr:DUF192 domain-containing protein [Consotaella salsifontis]SJZ50153.1 hypothetical protein SAMN05428963_10173 [Consotaella salsifontis]